jgi:hypothetical protein
MDSGVYERWNRIALTLLCVAVVMVAAAVYAVVDGDDAGAIAGSLVPAVVCLGLWRVALWRRDR